MQPSSSLLELSVTETGNLEEKQHLQIYEPLSSKHLYIHNIYDAMIPKNWNSFQKPRQGSSIFLTWTAIKQRHIKAS